MNARSVTSTLLSQAMRCEGFLMIHTEFLFPMDQCLSMSSTNTCFVTNYSLHNDL